MCILICLMFLQQTCYYTFFYSSINLQCRKLKICLWSVPICFYCRPIVLPGVPGVGVPTVFLIAVRHGLGPQAPIDASLPALWPPRQAGAPTGKRTGFNIRTSRYWYCWYFSLLKRKQPVQHKHHIKLWLMSSEPACISKFSKLRTCTLSGKGGIRTELI